MIDRPVAPSPRIRRTDGFRLRARFVCERTRGRESPPAFAKVDDAITAGARNGGRARRHRIRPAKRCFWPQHHGTAGAPKLKGRGQADPTLGEPLDASLFGLLLQNAKGIMKRKAWGCDVFAPSNARRKAKERAPRVCPRMDVAPCAVQNVGVAVGRGCMSMTAAGRRKSGRSGRWQRGPHRVLIAPDALRHSHSAVAPRLARVVPGAVPVLSLRGVDCTFGNAGTILTSCRVDKPKEWHAGSAQRSPRARSASALSHDGGCGSSGSAAWRARRFAGTVADGAVT